MGFYPHRRSSTSCGLGQEPDRQLRSGAGGGRASRFAGAVGENRHGSGEMLDTQRWRCPRSSWLAGRPRSCCCSALFLRSARSTRDLIAWLVAAVLGGKRHGAGRGPASATVSFSGMFIVDAFAQLHEGPGAGGIGGGHHHVARLPAQRAAWKFEFPVLILLATAGMLMMISANDLIMLYLGLELQSLTLYVIAAFRRDDLVQRGRPEVLRAGAPCRRACCSTAPR